jgi:hypothetical protein
MWLWKHVSNVNFFFLIEQQSVDYKLHLFEKELLEKLFEPKRGVCNQQRFVSDWAVDLSQFAHVCAYMCMCASMRLLVLSLGVMSENNIKIGLRDGEKERVEPRRHHLSHTRNWPLETSSYDMTN